MRVTAYTQDGTRVTFQGDKHDFFSLDCVRLQMARAVDGLASKPYPGGRGETGLGYASSGVRVHECFFG